MTHNRSRIMKSGNADNSSRKELQEKTINQTVTDDVLGYTIAVKKVMFSPVYFIVFSIDSPSAIMILAISYFVSIRAWCSA